MALNNTATYQILINWDDPNETQISTFETSLDGWVPESGVYLNRRKEQSQSGMYSAQLGLAITDNIVFDALPGFDTFKFGNKASPAVGKSATKTLTGLTIGVSYTVFGWAYVPNGARHVKLTCSSFELETQTNVNNEWIYLETSFTAAATSKVIEIWTVTTGGTIVDGPYIDNFGYKVNGEDVTCLVLGDRGSISTFEGRDFARALSAIRTAESGFDMRNTNQQFSPGNPASVLHTRPATNAPLQIRAQFEGRLYILYNGFIDDFILNFEQVDFSTVSISAFDVLGKLSATDVSTGLYQSVRTGQAIGYILDEIGWPAAKRKLDYGATVIDWWWVEETNALDAVKQLLNAEGLPSIAYVDDVGDFVFKDRHHRYLDASSTTVIANFDCQDIS